jgi:hypothetical protein
MPTTLKASAALHEQIATDIVNFCNSSILIFCQVLALKSFFISKIALASSCVNLNLM